MNDKAPHQNDTSLNPIGARLQQLLAALKTDPHLFSQRMGCSEQVLTDYLAHPTGANLEFLAMMLCTVDGLSADWLLTGRGDMMRPGTVLNYQNGNSGTTIATNHGIVLSITCSECQQQLKLCTLIIEQQQHQLEDKDRIIELLEAQQPNL